MKKRVFLAFGIILVFGIFALPAGVVPLEMKRIIQETTLIVEAGVVKVYKELRSFITDSGRI